MPVLAQKAMALEAIASEAVASEAVALEAIASEAMALEAVALEATASELKKESIGFCQATEGHRMRWEILAKKGMPAFAGALSLSLWGLWGQGLDSPGAFAPGLSAFGGFRGAL
jgi:hypothetical protein